MKFKYIPSTRILIVFSNTHILMILAENYWNKPAHIKEFLDSFASKRGFDPLHAENWYTISKEDLKREEVSQINHN